MQRTEVLLSERSHSADHAAGEVKWGQTESAAATESCLLAFLQFQGCVFCPGGHLWKVTFCSHHEITNYAVDSLKRGVSVNFTQMRGNGRSVKAPRMLRHT